MNICFLIGKIVSEIEFDFIINNKSNLGEKISIVRFKICLLDNTEINIMGYNKIADWCYKELKVGNIILIKGISKTNGNIEIEDMELIEKN